MLSTFSVPIGLLKIVHRLQSHGYRVVIVGGALRDFLLGREVSDYDLASDALPEQVQALFRRCIPTGIQHGTVTIMQGAEGYEITTFRCDGAYKDGRRPERVTFTGSLLSDLERRDFTINAIAFEPDPVAPLYEKLKREGKAEHKIEIQGLLHDPHSGRADLKQGQIRAIGAALQRFEEDALRMLRACRFSAKLGFAIEAQTLASIRELHGNLVKVSKPRIQEELSKLLTAPHAALGLHHLSASALWSDILLLPEPKIRHEKNSQSLPHLFGLWQGNWTVLQNWQTLGTVPHDAAPSFLAIFLRCVCQNKGLESRYLSWDTQKMPHFSFAWALLHYALLNEEIQQGSEESKQVWQSLQAVFTSKRKSREWFGWQLASQGLENLLFSKRERNAALYLLRWKNLVWGSDFLHAYAEQGEVLLRYWLALYGPDFSLPALLLLALSLEVQDSEHIKTLWHDMAQGFTTVLAQKPALCLQDLAINGRILAKDCGIPAGVHVAVILKELLALVLLDPKHNCPDILKHLAKKIYEKICAE